MQGYVSTAFKLLVKTVTGESSGNITVPTLYDGVAVLTLSICALRGSYEVCRDYYLINHSSGIKSDLAGFTGNVIIGGLVGSLVGLPIAAYWPITLPVITYYQFAKRIKFD